MPTLTSKGSRSGSGGAASSQTPAGPHPEQLVWPFRCLHLSSEQRSPAQQRNLVFNYLCHNCYLETARAFEKDSAVGHLDKDGDQVRDRNPPQGGLASASSAELGPELVMNILLRQRIQFEILSGNVLEATDLLNWHFPKVLAEVDGDDEMGITDENVNPLRFEYIAETVNPTYLSLNLRILAFIEACRTVPLVYTPPVRRTESPASPDSDVAMVAASLKRDSKGEEDHQSELLIYGQKLYATVNALRKPDDRAIYLEELSNVGGLLAYTVPENSPIAKYLHQERRDRVAEQINSAILHHTGMPSVSKLELSVRYTHCLWAMLHELRVKVPAATHQLNGVSFPPSTTSQGTNESEKEPTHEARPFDLQLFLDAKT